MKKSLSLVFVVAGLMLVSYVSKGSYNPGGGGGGALVLLEQHTASASNELDFTTALTSTYDEYKISFINVLPTGAGGPDLAIEFSTDGGMTYDTSTSNYSWGGLRWSDANTSGTNGTTVFAYIDLTGFGQLSNSSTYGFSGSFTLQGTSSSSVSKAVIGQGTFLDPSSGLRLGTGTFGWYIPTTVVNAFRIYMQTHNTAAYTQNTTIASGTVRVYGVAK